jgi:heme/copper-type cytochrome/quinol oxidase subunit 2
MSFVRSEVFLFALCVAACVLGHVAILRSVLRSRSSAADTNVPRPRLAIEVVWALVPAIALAVLLTFTWATVRERVHAQPGIMLRVAE